MSREITEQVDNLLEQLLYCDFDTNIGIDKAKKAIRLALKAEQKLDRKDILLKATYDILTECRKTIYVRDVFEQTAIWDNEECDKPKEKTK